MRINVYAEELTDRVEIVSKEVDGTVFTGLRFYLYLPATHGQTQVRGPFIHKPGDDDSSAVTFWGKRDLRELLKVAQDKLDQHYSPDGAAHVKDVQEEAPWIEWNGGADPVDAATAVDIKLRNGEIVTDITSCWWGRDEAEEESEIIAYRVRLTEDQKPYVNYG